MNKTEISDKIFAIAESAGLSPEEVEELLSGGEAIPEALKEVFDRIGDTVFGHCAED